MREEETRYFRRIEARLDEAFDVAEAAKATGYDPKTEVEIPVAKDMADRVENILGIDGVAERVRELEGQMSREEAALELVTDFVDGNVGDYDSREGKVEGAVRTAVALLTVGPLVLVAGREVVPGREGPSRAREHDDPRVGLLLDPREAVAEFPEEGRGQRVHLLRTVERHPDDPSLVAGVDGQVAVAVSRHLTRPSRAGVL